MESIGEEIVVIGTTDKMTNSPSHVFFTKAINTTSPLHSIILECMVANQSVIIMLVLKTQQAILAFILIHAKEKKDIIGPSWTITVNTVFDSIVKKDLNTLCHQALSNQMEAM